MIRKIKKGYKVFSQNDKSKEMYYIQSGSIKITHFKDGETIDLAHLQAGAVFGEMALIDGKHRSATAVAEEDSELFVVTEEEFNNRVSLVPAWYLALLRVTSERLRQVNEMMRKGHRLQIISNIAQLLVMIIKKAQWDSGEKRSTKAAKVDMKHVKQEILDIMGINRAALSDAMKFLEQKKMILQHANQITVKDTDDLLTFSRYLKLLRMEQDIVLMDPDLYFFSTRLLDLLEKNHPQEESVEIGYAYFQSQIAIDLDLQEGKIEWFLLSLKKMTVLKMILSDGRETASLKRMGSNDQLRLDFRRLASVLKEEDYKRMGI